MKISPPCLAPIDLSSLSDEALLDHLQHAAFQYFLQAVNPVNGLVADTSRADSPCSIAALGFALASYTVGVERGWMTRSDAVSRALAALRFLRDSVQSESAMATGFKGFYYHFLDLRSGLRVWQSELSMIDTALLIAGALTASSYFTEDAADEIALRDTVDYLYRRIDWRWAQDHSDTIRQGWKPECGFLHYGWEGYNEAILLYVLALGSPTHPIAGNCYEGWTATYQWENLYGHDYLYAGPLFMHHFSHAWIDFRGIHDPFMREKNSDYFENSRRAAYIHREYAQINPREFAGYDENCWGLSACDGPSDENWSDSSSARRLFGYAARGVPFGPDDGAVSPSSMLASLPFAPEIVMPGLRSILARFPEMLRDGRMASSFDPSVSDSEGRAWVSPGHFGLDQGIVTMMIENHRSGHFWALMRACPAIRDGLSRAGFRDGWLGATSTEIAP